MDRRNFIKISVTGGIMINSISQLDSFAETFREKSAPMPVVFVGHGSPTNAIENNEFTLNWAEIGKNIPKPTAILSVSAHWLTKGTFVTSMENPKTIYDFYGFPKELYALSYPAPGDVKLAGDIIKSVSNPEISKDFEWGLDHGTWSVLIKMFPKADIPVIQLSMDFNQPGDFHFELGKKLNFLRKRGVLIFCSGNIVHNLGRIDWSDKAHDWALEFDEISKKLISEKKYSELINYQKLGKSALLSIPTNDHYLPLLYSLGASEANDNIHFFNEKVTMGSLSMRGVIFG